MTKKFAIIDVETTGGSSRLDKITEIGIVIHDGTEILQTYQSLIYPERSIPYYITQITGITDEMVATAPRFYEIAKNIVELTEDCVFVAHNVRFDYGFICEEFKQLGYTFSKEKLCTVQMSKRAFPGLKSYSLGNLVRHFDIPLPNHHRALNDAIATSELFERIVKSNYYTNIHPILSRHNLKAQKLPSNLDPDFINSIPQVPGVYYFYNREGQVIYIGKSLHLRKRIYDHFADNNERAAKLQQHVYRIDYQCTGNELAALLLESFEIRKYNPSFNILQRKKQFSHGIGILNGKLEVITLPAPVGISVLRKYTQKSHAQNALNYLMNEHGICECVRSSKSKDLCLQARMGICAYEDDLPPLEKRYISLIDFLSRGFDNDGILSGPGRNSDEKFIALILDKQFYGMGYVTLTQSIHYIEELQEYLKVYPQHEDLPGLIRGYLKDHKDVKWQPVLIRQNAD
jgi:DNA polymerase III subunit epsilon